MAADFCGREQRTMRRKQKQGAWVRCFHGFSSVEKAMASMLPMLAKIKERDEKGADSNGSALNNDRGWCGPLI